MAALSEIDLIRNTINWASLHIDNKDYNKLEEIFTNDCTVNYPTSIGLTNGADAVIKTLDNLLRPIDTFHAVATQVVQLTGEDTAEATTYCSASHYKDEKCFFAEGKYDDKLVKVNTGGSMVWKIKERTTTAMGVARGDPSIFNKPR